MSFSKCQPWTEQWSVPIESAELEGDNPPNFDLTMFCLNFSGGGFAWQWDAGPGS